MKPLAERAGTWRYQEGKVTPMVGFGVDSHPDEPTDEGRAEFLSRSAPTIEDDVADALAPISSEEEDDVELREVERNGEPQIDEVSRALIESATRLANRLDLRFR